jgi:hypothetical protein
MIQGLDAAPQNKKRLLFDALGDLFKLYFEESKYLFLNQGGVDEWDAEFREAHLYGNISISMPSLIFSPEETNIDKLIINGEQLYCNVSYFSISNFDRKQVCMKTNEAVMGQGMGLYAKLEVKEGVVELGNASIIFATSDGFYNFSNVTQVSFVANNYLHLLIKTPSIEASGKITFKRLYTFVSTQPWGPLPREAKSDGNDLVIEGEINFSVLASDVTTIVNNLAVEKAVCFRERQIVFDEISTFPSALFWALIVTVLVIIIFFICLFEAKQIQTRM